MIPEIEHQIQLSTPAVGIDRRQDIEAEITKTPLDIEALEAHIPGFVGVYNSVRETIQHLVGDLDLPMPSINIYPSDQYQQYFRDVMGDSISPSVHDGSGSIKAGIMLYSPDANEIMISRDEVNQYMNNPKKKFQVYRALAEEYLHAATTVEVNGELRCGFQFVQLDPEDKRDNGGLYFVNRRKLSEEELADMESIPFTQFKEDPWAIHVTENVMNLMIFDLYGEDENPPADAVFFGGQTKLDKAVPVLTIHKQMLREIYGIDSDTTFIQKCFRVLHSGKEREFTQLLVESLNQFDPNLYSGKSKKHATRRLRKISERAGMSESDTLEGIKKLQEVMSHLDSTRLQMIDVDSFKDRPVIDNVGIQVVW